MISALMLILAPAAGPSIPLVIEAPAPSANPPVAGVGLSCWFSIEGKPVTLQARVPDSAAGWRPSDVLKVDTLSSGSEQFAAKPEGKLISFGKEYRRYWFSYPDLQQRDANYLIDMVLLDGNLGILNVSRTGPWDPNARSRSVDTVAHGYCRSDFSAPQEGQTR